MSSAAMAKAASTAPIITSTIPTTDHWFDGAPLPRGANHVAVAADRRPRLCARRLHRAEPQLRTPTPYAYDVAADRWTEHRAAAARARREPRPRSLDGKLHLIGGAGAPDRRARQRRLARGLRSQGRQMGNAQSRCPARATMSAASPHDGLHPYHRRPLQHLRIQHRPAPRLHRPRATPGRSARRCPPRARATASWSIATACSRWAARAASSTKGQLRQAKVFGADGELRSGDGHLAAACADADAAPCGGRHHDRRLGLCRGRRRGARRRRSVTAVHEAFTLGT